MSNSYIFKVFSDLMTIKPKRVHFTHFILFFLSIQSIFAQIVFKELPNYQLNPSDLSYIEKSSTRSIILLNGTWKVYNLNDDKKKKAKVEIPSIHNSETELVFEKYFEISSEQIKKNNLQLNFLGISHSADISINGKLIYRHTGGEFPFVCNLPKDILVSNKKNLLSVSVISKVDSWNTIPLKQSFLYPQRFGGIFRDVFIRLIPNTNISSLQFDYNFRNNNNTPTLKFNIKIVNNEFFQSDDSIAQLDVFEIKYTLHGGLEKPQFSLSSVFQLKRGKEKIINNSLDLSNPTLWSPAFPFTYQLNIQILRQGTVIDEVIKPISFYALNPQFDSLLLNGAKFQINGVTYIQSNYKYGGLASIEQMRQDIKIIKEMGFNMVRFAKGTPHPYLLSLCEEFGLLAFIELPIQSPPLSLLEEKVFLERSKNYLNMFWKAYGNFSSVAAVGFGGSYLGGSEYTAFYLNELSDEFRKRSSKPLYCSFVNLDFQNLPKINFFGLEVFNKSISKISDRLSEAVPNIGSGRVFLSEASFLTNLGNSNGSTNPNTIESQAKNIEDLITFFEQGNYAGYFLNTMFDYHANYNSILSGYSKEKLVSLGIVGEDRNIDRLTYKVVYSKLHNLEKITVPFGVKKDDSPMVFIVSGLILALILGFLVNSGRKFREDASRALLRPYNFFADIRDLRIISGLHTTLLALIVSATLALITISVMYSLKSELFYEKFFIVFGNENILDFISYLTWHPLNSLLMLSGLFFFLILSLALLVKFFSFFVMNRVFFSNAYYTIVWSFLPVVLAIPFAIVLYRIIIIDIATIYLIAVLIVLAMWVLYRILKGIYVIYDVRPGSVYFYSIVFIIALLSGVVIYFQVYSSSLDYLLQVFREFKVRV
jgi:beta-galactosidase